MLSHGKTATHECTTDFQHGVQSCENLHSFVYLFFLPVATYSCHRQNMMYHLELIDLILVCCLWLNKSKYFVPSWTWFCGCECNNCPTLISSKRSFATRRKNYLIQTIYMISFMFAKKMERKRRPAFASLIECPFSIPLWSTLTCSVYWTSPCLMNIIWWKHSDLLFTLHQQTAQLASFSAPIFNTAMRPLIMQGFK